MLIHPKAKEVGISSFINSIPLIYDEKNNYASFDKSFSAHLDFLHDILLHKMPVYRTLIRDSDKLNPLLQKWINDPTSIIDGELAYHISQSFPSLNRFLKFSGIVRLSDVAGLSEILQHCINLSSPLKFFNSIPNRERIISPLIKSNESEKSLLQSASFKASLNGDGEIFTRPKANEYKNRERINSKLDDKNLSCNKNYNLNNAHTLTSGMLIDCCYHGIFLCKNF